MVDKSEGVILHALDFKDFDKILTVFTPAEGIIKMFVKGAKRPKSHFKAVSPLVRAEFIYCQGNGDLFKCQEISIIDYRLSLRNSLPLMEASFQMAQQILKSQLPNTPSELPYRLFNFYLDRIPKAKDPFAVSISFKLKLLRLEGMFGTDYFRGFSAVEMQLLQQLAFCTAFKDIASLDLTACFRTKVSDAIQNLLH